MSITHQTVADLRTLVEEVELLRKQRALTDEDIKQAQDYARDVERAAIVKFIRKERDRYHQAGRTGPRGVEWTTRCLNLAAAYTELAREIENGAHSDDEDERE